MTESCLLGQTDIRISRLCFGGWQASGWSSSNDLSFKKTLAHALDSGINFIDTAEAYGDGHSETLIGQVVRGRDRKSLVIASKFSHSHSEPALIRKSLDSSLSRLQTDYLDLYQQHWPPRRPPLVDAVVELERLKAEGKIRAIGVSNWMDPEWREIDNPGRIDSLQPCYSLLWRSIEPQVLPLCIRHSIAVLPYSPLCQGLLTGRFSREEDIPKDFRSKNRLFSASSLAALQSFLGTLSRLSHEYGRPMGAIALRWLLDQNGVTAAVVGASSPQQVDENLKALSWHMEPQHLTLLSESSLPFSAHLRPHDTLWNWHPRGTRS